jgi:hypothetical protein
VIGKPLDRLRLEMTSGPGRYVVDHEGQAAGVGDVGEMGVESFLGGPVVVGGNDQCSVGARLGSEPSQPDRLGRGAGTGAG